jgi:hypothetical protein
MHTRGKGKWEGEQTTLPQLQRLQENENLLVWISTP